MYKSWDESVIEIKGILQKKNFKLLTTIMQGFFSSLEIICPCKIPYIMNTCVRASYCCRVEKLLIRQVPGTWPHVFVPPSRPCMVLDYIQVGSRRPETYQFVLIFRTKLKCKSSIPQL